MKGSRIVWLSLILGSVVLLGSAFMMNVMHEQAHKVIYEEAGIKANIQYGLFSGITTADTNNVPDWVVAQQMQTESFGYQQQAATLSIMLMMLCCTILLILTKV